MSSPTPEHHLHPSVPFSLHQDPHPQSTTSARPNPSSQPDSGSSTQIDPQSNIHRTSTNQSNITTAPTTIPSSNQETPQTDNYSITPADNNNNIVNIINTSEKDISFNLTPSDSHTLYHPPNPPSISLPSISSPSISPPSNHLDPYCHRLNLQQRFASTSITSTEPDLTTTGHDGNQPTTLSIN
jgi:hypothetical protein